MTPHFAALAADLAKSREEQTAALRRKIDEAKARVRLDQVASELRLTASSTSGTTLVAELPRARLVALAEVVESEAKMLVARLQSLLDEQIGEATDKAVAGTLNRDAGFQSGFEAAQERIGALQATVAALDVALHRYGTHLRGWGCGDGLCICGFVPNLGAATGPGIARLGDLDRLRREVCAAAETWVTTAPAIIGSVEEKRFLAALQSLRSAEAKS